MLGWVVLVPWPKLFGETLGYGLWPSPWWRQGAEVAGMPGLTAVLVLGNAAVLGALRALGRSAPLAMRLRAAVALVAALSGFGWWRLVALEARPDELLRAGVIQASVGRYEALAAEVGTWEAVARILDAYMGLSAEALAQGSLDLLVWPETAYPTTFGSPKSAEGADFDRAIARFVAHAGLPLVFGTCDLEGRAEFNAAPSSSRR